jgi:hypothetical protein
LLSGDELVSENIKAIYGFNPVNKEYVRFYPNPENDKIGGSDIAWKELMKMNAFWVYVDSEVAENVIKEEFYSLTPKKVNEYTLLTGWNMVGIMPEMVGKSSDEISGTCIIEKKYLFDIATQSWDELTLETKIPEEFVGLGLVVKVTDDCQLGFENEISAPPAIPSN